MLSHGVGHLGFTVAVRAIPGIQYPGSICVYICARGDYDLALIIDPFIRTFGRHDRCRDKIKVKI